MNTNADLVIEAIPENLELTRSARFRRSPFTARAVDDYSHAPGMQSDATRRAKLRAS